MAINPHFLQGSQGEQRLVQDLINEHLKIYGIEVRYIPRKFVRQQSIIREVQSSTFDDNFLLEAYVNTYDGYGCLLYTSPSPRDRTRSRMPSSA